MTEDTDARPGSPGGPLWDPTARPAATAILLRDRPDGVETLMLRRNKNLTFAGGMWVFPGGRIDHDDFVGEPPADHDPDRNDRLESAARRAATRETAEEAGLSIDPDRLTRWSQWTPPPETVKRYSTAFYVYDFADDAHNQSDDVVIDDSEIRAHRWQRPADVLKMRADGVVGLTPPTFITLIHLRGYETASDVVTAAQSQTLEHFATRFVADGDTIVAMYHGDAGYESGDIYANGPRHRLLMGKDWTYTRIQ